MAVKREPRLADYGLGSERLLMRKFGPRREPSAFERELGVE